MSLGSAGEVSIHYLLFPLKKLSTIALVFYFLISLSSCRQSEVAPEAEKKYFDIPLFFKKESERLTSERKYLKKVIIKDKIREEKIIQEPEWEQELSAFMQIDVNKPAFINTYRKDTLMLSENSYEVRYTAIETPLTIPLISLIFENSSCIFVSVKKDNSNKLFSSVQELQYNKETGFFISGKLDVRYFYKTEYQIESIFYNDQGK